MRNGLQLKGKERSSSGKGRVHRVLESQGNEYHGEGT